MRIGRYCLKKDWAHVFIGRGITRVDLFHQPSTQQRTLTMSGGLISCPPFCAGQNRAYAYRKTKVRCLWKSSTSRSCPKVGCRVSVKLFFRSYFLSCLGSGRKVLPRRDSVPQRKWSSPTWKATSTSVRVTFLETLRLAHRQDATSCFRSQPRPCNFRFFRHVCPLLADHTCS